MFSLHDFTPSNISIHAPRAGSDGTMQASTTTKEISIHAPRAGSDWRILRPLISGSLFQSTLPVRGATSNCILGRPATSISIHAPRAGSDVRGAICLARSPYISIHAPRAGSDRVSVARLQLGWNFNPRSPCGERPQRAAHIGDAGYFNPRSPCGERLGVWKLDPIPGRFQSTLPVRGATWIPFGCRSLRGRISIHAPRAGSDC